jgi:hypothetical protein
MTCSTRKPSEHLINKMRTSKIACKLSSFSNNIAPFAYSSTRSPSLGYDNMRSNHAMNRDRVTNIYSVAVSEIV